MFATKRDESFSRVSAAMIEISKVINEMFKGNLVVVAEKLTFNFRDIL